MSEGRRESLLYRTVIYAILIAGVVPVLLPFYWLLVASLKTKQRVEAYPPEWLPTVPRAFVRIEGQELPAKIIDDGRASGTSVCWVKLLDEQGGVLRLPAADLHRTESVELYADIEGVRRRVRIRDGLQDPASTNVDVLLVGSARQLTLPAAGVESVIERRCFWSVLGTELRVTTDGPVGERPEVVVSWSGPSEAVRVAPDRLVEAGVDAAPTTVEWAARRLPVEIVSRRTPGGYAVVRLVSPAGGLPTPWEELRDEEKVRHFATIDGARREVRKLSEDQAAGTVRVELLDEPEVVSVPRSAIQRVARVEYRANVLGEEVIVEPVEGSGFGGQGSGFGVQEVGSADRGVRSIDQAAHDESPRTPRSAPRTDSSLITQRRSLATQVSGLSTQESAPTTRDSATPSTLAVRVPGAIAVVESQLRRETSLSPQWVNFQKAWKEQTFDLYVANTLFIAALVVLGTVLSCGLVGYAFARLEFRGREFLFLLMLATMMIPAQITSIPTFVMFVKFGWLDSYKPLIVPSLLAGSAFFVFLYRQFMMTIPADLEDSARIDGCGPLATWWLIMMPLSKPIIVTVAVFTFIGVWNDFLGPLLYINTDEKQTVALGLQSFKSAFQADEPQLLMAASVMMMLPSIFLFFIAQKAFIRGVVVTGVKG